MVNKIIGDKIDGGKRFFFCSKLFYLKIIVAYVLHYVPTVFFLINILLNTPKTRLKLIRPFKLSTNMLAKKYTFHVNQKKLTNCFNDYLKYPVQNMHNYIKHARQLIHNIDSIYT